ncbi:MAG: hypothetical protein JO094_02730 [Hyphomicrobiales bacterium]|nr:hypothetical protein [Hyphomicrobiales bacterium]MBV9052554.1 hypothetical protein [Hyphomicrobiales bacterium]MBV9976297.1 hypothetical protein [Hyphomicrobiales bacterium]
MQIHLTDAERWRQRAEEMRRLGEDTRDQKVRQILLRLATDYEAMAESADRQHANGRRA